MAGALAHFANHPTLRGVVVVSRIAEKEHGRLRADIFAVLLPENLESVAVIAVTVDPHDVGFGVHAMDRLGDVFGGLEVFGDLVEAVDEDERPHLRELTLDCVHQHEGEASESGDASRNVGNDHQLGLGGTRILELRLSRHTAVRERVTHRIAEIERTLATVTTLAGQTSGQLSRQWVQGLLQVLHLVATGVHELDVFGQRLAQGLRHCFGAAVGHESTANFGFDFLLELFDAMLHLVVLESLFEIGLRLAHLL